MGIVNRIGGLKIPQGRGSSSWNPNMPLGGELPNLWSTSRDGYDLVDAEGGTNPKILPATFSKYYTGDYAEISDNGALDVGASDFTFYAVIRNEIATKTSTYYTCGKAIAGSKAGKYGFLINPTTGYYVLSVQSSASTKTIISNVDSTTAGFVHLRMEYETATTKLRFYVNNVLQGAEQTLGGNMPALANDYKFYIGCGQGASAPYSPYGISRTSHGDTFILKRLMTEQEKTDALNGVIPSGCLAHWPCNTFVLYDVSGNGYHLTEHTAGSLTGANILWGENGGSLQPLNKGYSLYKHIYGADLQVPYLTSGTPIVAPTVPAGYYFVRNVPGNLTGHNMANSMILFDGAGWDRSDIVTCSDYARVAYAPVQTAGYVGNIRFCYLAAIPKAWHIVELETLKIKEYLNDAFEMTSFAKFSDDSLDEIFCYDTAKTDTNLKTALDYSLNYDAFHDITYEFESDHWCTTRDNKVLKFDNVSFILSLSLDGGVTFPHTVDLTGVCTIIKRARIYANGNILFAGDNNIFYSEDNLATYHATTVTGIDGLPFAASPLSNYQVLCENRPIFISGYEVDVWGTYALTDPPDTSNINVWCSIDGGKNVKSIYKGAYMGMLSFRHAHAINYCSIDNSFWIQTGDGTDECAWIKGTVTLPANTWVWNIICTDNDGGSDVFDKNNTIYKSVGMGWDAEKGYIVWGSDSTYVTLYKYGIWRAIYSDIVTQAKYERLLDVNYEAGCFFDGGDGVMICTLQTTKELLISTDYGRHWYNHRLVGGPGLPADWGGYWTIKQKMTDGRYLIEIIDDTEWHDPVYGDYNINAVLLLQITKPS